MRFIFFLILIILSNGCEKNKILYRPDPKWDSVKKIYNNDIGKKVFSQLKNEKALYVCESGCGFRGRKNIHCMHCGFDYFNEITLEEARKLLIETTNLYLETINKNKQIRPFLENYPFIPENIEIRIFLYSPRGGNPTPEKLRFIRMIDGNLMYSTGQIDSQGFRTVICEESYEEALVKLRTTVVSNMDNAE